MAEAIRRLLGLVPVLLVGSIVLFFLLGSHPAVQRQGRLPLFFQEKPVSASSAALAAMRGAARGDAQAIRDLQALGGAALPHVLPRLSELDVAERRRVADALTPIALRLEIDGYRSTVDKAFAAPRDSADERLLAWERFYEDHDLDFRPLSVERLVRRLSSRRSGTRQGDLRAVDTYALPYLVRTLGRVDSQSDVDRVVRLTPSIAELTSANYSLSEDADVRTARALASRIRKDFDRTGSKFTDLGRLETLTAHVTQTEFGVWWVQTLRELRGIDSPVVFSGLAAAFGSSASLLMAAFAGALLLGPLAAGALELVQLGRTSPIRPRRIRVFFAATSGLCLPLFCLVGTRSTWTSIVLLLVVSTLVSSFVLSSEIAGDFDWRVRAVLARRSVLSRCMATGTALGACLPTLLPLIAGEAFVWVACLELASGKDGLFPRALLALNGGDLHALLALSLLSWICIALVQTLSDALLRTSEPRWTSW